MRHGMTSGNVSEGVNELTDEMVCPLTATTVGGNGSISGIPVEGSPDEVTADNRRARAPGVDYLTFDMPKLDVPGMVRTMERFVKEVKPAAA